jgi:hypothetical protein
MPEPKRPWLKAYGIRHRAKQSPSFCFALYTLRPLSKSSDKHADTEQSHIREFTIHGACELYIVKRIGHDDSRFPNNR